MFLHCRLKPGVGQSKCSAHSYSPAGNGMHATQAGQLLAQHLHTQRAQEESVLSQFYSNSVAVLKNVVRSGIGVTFMRELTIVDEYE